MTALFIAFLLASYIWFAICILEEDKKKNRIDADRNTEILYFNN